MALHELCTNAVKYGALASEHGARLHHLEPVGERPPYHHLDRNRGPQVSAPTGKGFGSRMIERALAADLGASVGFDYAAEGLVCTIPADRHTIVVSHPPPN